MATPRLRLGSLLQPAGTTIFPGGDRRLPRAAKSPCLAGPPLALRSSDAANRSVACVITDKAAMGATFSTKGIKMTAIGTFTQQDDGFHGTLRTLALDVKCRIVPIARANGNGPDYRVLAGTVEIGAAWKRQSKAQTHYLSVKIDDPMLPAPLNARLISGEGGVMNLYWSRRGDA
jgi:uncharacterized protein (DUF736 family)